MRPRGIKKELQTMRLRQIKKELQKQESIFKRSKAAYDTAPNKDGPVARLHLTRMEKARQEIAAYYHTPNNLQTFSRS